MTSEQFRSNPLFLRNHFRGVGRYGIPFIKRNPLNLQSVKFIGYDKIKSNDSDNINKFVHFFLDDYKFEVLWNDPEPRIEKLKQYRGVLTPQFSLFTEMPIALQIYNTFRSRWCGAYLQSKGINVIPTISWGFPNSFSFAFAGVAEGSVVAVSTLGVKNEKQLFMRGYNEMLSQINPTAIICYSQPFKEMEGNIIVVNYAETNNLAKSDDGTRINLWRRVGLEEIEKGMGGSLDGEDAVGSNTLGKLNWDTIVSKKGELRIDHINRHTVPQPTRATHGVFNGNPKKMVDEAWENRGNITPIDDGMGGSIYNIPYPNAGYESGYINTGAQMDYITIITITETSDLIAAFPSYGDYVK